MGLPPFCLQICRIFWVRWKVPFLGSEENIFCIVQDCDYISHVWWNLKILWLCRGVLCKVPVYLHSVSKVHFVWRFNSFTACVLLQSTVIQGEYLATGLSCGFSAISAYSTEWHFPTQSVAVFCCMWGRYCKAEQGLSFNIVITAADQVWKAATHIAA
jgi:hypothetical protein